MRKVGVPYQPELAMGAVAEGGVTIRNEDVLAAAERTMKSMGVVRQVSAPASAGGAR